MAKRPARTATGAEEGQHLTVKAPSYRRAVFRIRGTTPYVQHKFSQKVQEEMHAAQEAGSTAKSKKKRKPKDFKANYEAAMHKTREGWIGLPANGIRAAMIDACRTIGVVMTHAKMAVFVEADGFDPDDGTPLVKITKGRPHYHEAAARNANGMPDLRARPMWEPGWEAKVTVRFDADMIDLESVGNLLLRVGQQVGLGEGRPFSKKSCGMGWGLFEIVGEAA